MKCDKQRLWPLWGVPTKAAKTKFFSGCVIIPLIFISRIGRISGGLKEALLWKVEKSFQRKSRWNSTELKSKIKFILLPPGTWR